jgi:glycosyl transferase family 25
MAQTGPRTRILVVSMKGAHARRDAFTAAAGGATLPWSFLDACERLHPDLDYDEDAAVVAKGRPLTRGEIGCYSSHFEAWKQLLAGDHDQYIVLEDDVVADWDYLAALARMDHGAAGRDYIRLYYKKPVPARVIERDFGARARWLTEVAGYCFGTQGYLITRRGARVFAGRFRRVRRPIDDEMDRSWAHGVPNLAVFPFPIIERAQESGIGLDRFAVHEVPPRLRLRRAIQRQRDRIGFHLLGRARERAR